MWTNEIADLSRRDPRDTVDEGANIRELEIDLRLLDGGFHGLNRRFGSQVGLDLVIQLALRNRLFLCERRIALNIQLRLPELRLGLCELRPCLIEQRLEWTRIDVEQHLVFADNLTFPVVLPDQIYPETCGWMTAFTYPSSVAMYS